jgi:hypothetical protein
MEVETSQHKILYQHLYIYINTYFKPFRTFLKQPTANVE